MDLRPGLDFAVCHDGGRRMAGLARGGMEKPNMALGVVPASMAAQCPLDTFVLRGTPPRYRLRRYCDALVDTGCDNDLLLSNQPPSRDIANSLSGLGQLCCCPEFCHLAFEHLNARQCKNLMFSHRP